jgi:hypothetical protein
MNIRNGTRGAVVMSDIESAIQFVRNHGNKVEQARLNVLVQTDMWVEETVQELKGAQREDGGLSLFRGQ